MSNIAGGETPHKNPSLHCNGGIIVIIKVYQKNFEFENNKNYLVSGENENIIIISLSQKWTCIQRKNSFEKDKKFIFKIKLFNSLRKNIFEAVSPSLSNNIDLNLNTIKKINLRNLI